MKVLVFKTNLTDKEKIRDVRSCLDVHPFIDQWNVDLHDDDKVLRIVTTGVAGREVEALITGAGYSCKEFN